MKHTKFKHVGKVYNLKLNDKITCFKTGEVLKVVKMLDNYIFTLSNEINYTPNQIFNFVNG